MRVVIDRLSNDIYGELNKWNLIGKEVLIDEDFESIGYDYPHPDYGYCIGSYIGDSGEARYCYSFTCVCLDDEGYPL